MGAELLVCGSGPFGCHGSRFRGLRPRPTICTRFGDAGLGVLRFSACGSKVRVQSFGKFMCATNPATVITTYLPNFKIFILKEPPSASFEMF